MLKEDHIWGGKDHKFIKHVGSALGAHRKEKRCQVGRSISKVGPVLLNLSHQYKGN